MSIRPRSLQPTRQAVTHMPRASQPSRFTRRLLLGAPVVAVAVAGALASSNTVKDATTVAIGAFGGTVSPSPSAGELSIFWAPGARLQLPQSSAGYQLPGTNVHVELLETPAGINRNEWLQTLIAADRAPDVISGYLACDLRKTMLGSDHTELVRRDRFPLEQFDSGAYRAFESGGRLWALPYAWVANEIGIAIDTGRLPSSLIDEQPPGRQDFNSRLVSGWSWDEFCSAISTISLQTRDTNSLALERFGTIRTLPNLWGASWSDTSGKSALANRDGLFDALKHFEELRAIVLRGAAGTKSPVPTPRSGNSPRPPSPPAVPTPGVMRGPSAVAIGTGGRSLMRTGIAVASAFDFDEARDLSRATFLPIPRGTASATDVEPLLVSITTTGASRGGAWALVRWLVENGRLARSEGLVPAWRPAQVQAIDELSRSPLGGADPSRLDVPRKLFTAMSTPVSVPRDGAPLAIQTPLPGRRSSAIEVLILNAIRRAPMRDPVLDGPAGREARVAIATGLRAWEEGASTIDATLDELGPVLQSVLDRSRSALPT